VTKKSSALPVVDVDQVFPVLTTEGVSRGAAASGTGDQAPAVTAAIRDVLGWRPRAKDAKAFGAALDASFDLKEVEGHVEATYHPRGYAIQADLGGVSGGQASLYARARSARQDITRLLESLQPLRPDANLDDCNSYRALVGDTVRRVVDELGRLGGPRVALVDAAFTMLTGFTLPGNVSQGVSPKYPSGRTVASALVPAPTVPLAVPQVDDPDAVAGQLGALRERFGLIDDNVNKVEHETMRTAFWTLVGHVTSLQDSWQQQRGSFGIGGGRGFLGTDLVVINQLLAAAAEQVDEVEAVLDSTLISAAERQTIWLDQRGGLTLDGYLSWLRTFLTEDGPRILIDTGRDGLTTSFTPTALALLTTLRTKLVAAVIPCGSLSCGGSSGCRCGHQNVVTCLPIGCCPTFPPGMYAARTRIALSGLCGLLQRLESAAAGIGRFSQVVLFDVVIEPITDLDLHGVVSDSSVTPPTSDYRRVEFRGLHLRPSYLPAFVIASAAVAGKPLSDVVLPVHASASADTDSTIGFFHAGSLPAKLGQLTKDGAIVLAASQVPVTIVDGETGRPVLAPPVLSWPTMQPARRSSVATGPDSWGSDADLVQDQRWVPQSTRTDDVPTQDECEPASDCVEPCGCTCGSTCSEGCLVMNGCLGKCGCQCSGGLDWQRAYRLNQTPEFANFARQALAALPDLPLTPDQAEELRAFLSPLAKDPTTAASARKKLDEVRKLIIETIGSDFNGPIDVFNDEQSPLPETDLPRSEPLPSGEDVADSRTLPYPASGISQRPQVQAEGAMSFDMHPAPLQSPVEVCCRPETRCDKNPGIDDGDNPPCRSTLSLDARAEADRLKRLEEDALVEADRLKILVTEAYAEADRLQRIERDAQAAAAQCHDAAGCCDAARCYDRASAMCRPPSCCCRYPSRPPDRCGCNSDSTETERCADQAPAAAGLESGPDTEAVHVRDLEIVNRLEQILVSKAAEMVRAAEVARATEVVAAPTSKTPVVAKSATPRAKRAPAPSRAQRRSAGSGD
jgi:hypothetical protein